MKISVITVSYNSAKTLEETIKSVLSQNYPDLEYIIIDGGSVDGTLDIIKQYEDKIAYWVSEPDKGISDAFNKGIKQATGDLICIINSDDTLLPDVLNEIASKINNESDIIHGNLYLYRPEYNTEMLYCSQDNLDFSKGHYYGIMHPAALIRKRAYDKYGVYDVSLKYCMDNEIFLRMYAMGAKFQRIDLAIARYATGGASGVKNYHKVAHESVKTSIKYGSPVMIAYYRLVRNMLQIYAIHILKKLKFGH